MSQGIIINVIPEGKGESIAPLKENTMKPAVKQNPAHGLMLCVSECVSECVSSSGSGHNEACAKTESSTTG